MNCQAFLNLLDLHREGRLTPARRAETQRHAQSCPACRAASSSFPRPAEIRAPVWFKENLAKALNAEMPGIPAPVEVDDPGRWVLPAAAAYACLALILYWTSPEIPSQGLEPLIAFAGETR